MNKANTYLYTAHENGSHMYQMTADVCLYGQLACCDHES